MPAPAETAPRFAKKSLFGRFFLASSFSLACFSVLFFFFVSRDLARCLAISAEVSFRRDRRFQGASFCPALAASLLGGARAAKSHDDVPWPQWSGSRVAEPCSTKLRAARWKSSRLSERAAWDVLVAGCQPCRCGRTTRDCRRRSVADRLSCRPRRTFRHGARASGSTADARGRAGGGVSAVRCCGRSCQGRSVPLGRSKERHRRLRCGGEAITLLLRRVTVSRDTDPSLIRLPKRPLSEKTKVEHCSPQANKGMDLCTRH